MPLFAWSTLAYIAALIVALSGTSTTRAVLSGGSLCGAIVLTRAGRRTPATIAALAAAACLIAEGVRRHESQCATRMTAARELRISLEGDATPGGMTRANATLNGCESRATILVSRGEARDGDVAVVRGRASMGPRGLFIPNATISRAAPGPLLARARAAAGRRIDRIFTSDAPMVRALVIADMSRIPPDQRDRYARAGLVHMLSVSGLHVGIVALALELLASVLRLPANPSRIATMLLLTIYVAAIGAPPPAVRAAVMLGALLLCRLMQRPTSPWAILALGAAAPLWNPGTALDLGWQLSVAGTAALIAGAALAGRIIPRPWRGARRALATAALVSVIATMVTAPLVAWAFGRVSLIGPITNLLADPVMGVLQPLLFVAMAIPVGGVESLIADAAHALLAVFDAIARGAAQVPGSAPRALPTTIAALASGVASVALVIACVGRNPARASLVAACAVAVIMIEPLLPRGRAAPELHMIDVGQGDALALRTSRGRWIVVDAGRSWRGGDAGQSTVAPYLARRGGDVAIFVLSHPHADHVGGAASLFSLMKPGRFLDPGYIGTSQPYVNALGRARTDGIPWQRVRPGESIVVDDIVLDALAPDSAWAAQLTDANLASTVISAHAGGSTILFTGDAEVGEEDWLLEHQADRLRADVLKVAHHGSSTSTSSAFLHAVNPRLALVSVGAHNAYGHPSRDIMASLDVAGVTTLRTDQLGTVVLRFVKSGIEVEARGERWLVPRQVIR